MGIQIKQRLTALKKNLVSRRPKRKRGNDTSLFRLYQSCLLPITLFNRVNALLFGLVLLSCGFLVVLIIERVSLYPLVERQFIYAEFMGAEHNYVNVLHTKRLRNERLVESILRRYVIEREQIVSDPSRVVDKYSSPIVYDLYFNQVLKTIAERNIRSRVRRFIKILRYQVIESNVRQFEVEFTDLLKYQDKSGETRSRFSKTRCLINIKFIFDDASRRVDEVRVNPAGLFVTAYQIKRMS